MRFRCRTIKIDPNQLTKILSIHCISPFSVKKPSVNPKIVHENCFFMTLCIESVVKAGEVQTTAIALFGYLISTYLDSCSFYFSFRFCILYIHCFVYTVYDDFGGQ